MVDVTYGLQRKYFGLTLGDTPRPYLAVRLANGPSSFATFGLVDSGADVTMFHSEIGRALGFDLATGYAVPIAGVGGNTNAFGFIVDLEVAGRQFQDLVFFGDHVPQAYGLLGRLRFFQQFAVGFNEPSAELLLDERSTLAALAAAPPTP